MTNYNFKSKKRFYVLIGDVQMSDTILHIINSYTILSAHIEYNNSSSVPNIDYNIFGTFCHIDTEPNIQNMFSIISSKGLRYFGYVNGCEYILSIGEKGHVGIPLQMSKILIPDGMYELSDYNISLTPSIDSNNFNNIRGLIGSKIKYYISGLIKTKYTYSYIIIINGEKNYLTRICLNGQTPFISKNEMEEINGITYEECIGYPVIM